MFNLFRLIIGLAMLYIIVMIVMATVERIQPRAPEPSRSSPATATGAPTDFLPGHGAVKGWVGSFLHPAKPKTPPAGQGQSSVPAVIEVHILHGLPVCADLAALTGERISKMAITGEYTERRMEPSGKRCVDN